MSRAHAATDQPVRRTRSQTGALKRNLDWLGKVPELISSHLVAIYGELVQQGFDPEIAQHVLDAAQDGKTPAAELRNRLRTVLAEMILVEKPAEFFAHDRAIS